MYDLAVIGAGPGGSCAAVRAAELGAKVCLIEKDLLGGVCLNRGCISTKTIIRSLEVIQEIRRAPEFGIEVSGPSVDISKIGQRTNSVVLRLRQGLETLLKSKGIDIVRGKACIYDSTKVEVGGKALSSKYIIIATGSGPMEEEGLKADHKYILSSDDILQLNKIPESIVIIGGGVIGCEFASIYQRLGSKVTIIELMDQLLPNEDAEIARRLEASFKKSGIDIIKGAKVCGLALKDGIMINLGDSRSLRAELALLCIGRRPNLSGLNPDKTGLKIDNNGVQVDGHLRTNLPNIYAVGDVTGRHYLAHLASYEGVLASENIFKQPGSADYSCVPNSIFTYPQIGSLGITEEKAKELGLKFLVTKVPFAAIGKAQILGETDGFIKLISDAKTDQILGAHIFGAGASELISGFALAMKTKTTTKKLGEVVYPHPTLSEGMLEAVRRVARESN